jgi:hypothetical protein
MIYTAAVAFSPLVHAVRVIRNPRLIGVRAKAAGLLGLFGSRFYRAYRMSECLVKYTAQARP